jgi:hypothetical protein
MGRTCEGTGNAHGIREGSKNRGRLARPRQVLAQKGKSRSRSPFPPNAAVTCLYLIDNAFFFGAIFCDYQISSRGFFVLESAANGTQAIFVLTGVGCSHAATIAMDPRRRGLYGLHAHDPGSGLRHPSVYGA